MRKFLIFLLLTVSRHLPMAAEDWPRFRGPNGSGVSDAKNLPVEFGAEKNVLWKASLPPGHSSPIVAGRHIFLTAHEKDKLITVALDRLTGKMLWKNEVLRSRSANLHPLNSPTSPSPAADGRSVFVFFHDFGLICYSKEGRERWRLPLGPFRNNNGMGASPIVSQGLLLLVCDQDVGSFVLAVNKENGQIRWRKERSNTLAAGYSTPVVLEGSQDGPHLIVPGSFQLMAYKLKTGESTWWVNGLPLQPKGSPIIGGTGSARDTIYMSVQGVTEMTPPPFAQLVTSLDKDKNGELSFDEVKTKQRLLGGLGFLQADMSGDGVLTENEWSFVVEAMKASDLLLAVRPGTSRGDLTQKNVLWRYRKALPRVPSPLLYQNVLYLLKEGGILTSVNPDTGEVIKQARLREALDPYLASPVAADEKVYVVSQAGKISVLKAAGNWEVLATNDLAEECFATPAITDGRIYLRTKTKLYCFGEK